ncbi:MAG: peptide-methionine (S)-S-oxide reductase MsrA [bacterium]|nr:peptide-methionine (S)-S-oxide reductase MsrA [bacterium]
MALLSRKTEMPPRKHALPGREAKMPVTNRHTVLDHPILPPFPENLELALFGMGCFWGAEKRFWLRDGVWTTAVGYTAGFTPNPTYEEVCSGLTGHSEVVRVAFDPGRTSFAEMLRIFWEGHDPTQGMRQGGDVGTQYRSGIYVLGDAQRLQAETSREAFAKRLAATDYGEITTEIQEAGPFYYAEDYHQQYLDKRSR